MSNTQSSIDTFSTNTETSTIAYSDISSEEDLITYTQQYAARAITQYDLDINYARITHWDVTAQTEGLDTAIKCANIEENTPAGITTQIGDTTDWNYLTTHTDLIDHTENNEDLPFDDARNVAVTLSWSLYETLDEQEWQETIRHELIHVEQYQQYGEITHGLVFSMRAEELNTTNNCQKIYDGQYLLVCSDCGEVITDRDEHDEHVTMADATGETDEPLNSSCCRSRITLETNE